MFPNGHENDKYSCDHGLQQGLENQLFLQIKVLLFLFHSLLTRYTTGEITNLMEVDSQRFQDLTSYICLLFFSFLSYLQTLWSGPFQIILALSLLLNYVWNKTQRRAFLDGMACFCGSDRDSDHDSCFQDHFKETQNHSSIFLSNRIFEKS